MAWALIATLYLLAAAAFYSYAARTALSVEEDPTGGPTPIRLTVEEGGLNRDAEDLRAA